MVYENIFSNNLNIEPLDFYWIDVVYTKIFNYVLKVINFSVLRASNLPNSKRILLPVDIHNI